MLQWKRKLTLGIYSLEQNEQTDQYLHIAPALPQVTRLHSLVECQSQVFWLPASTIEYEAECTLPEARIFSFG